MNNRLAKWEKLREKGKWHYVLKYGILGWGVITAVLFSTIFSLVMGGEGKASFFSVLSLSMVLSPVGGVAWGFFMWNFNEKAYQKAKASEYANGADA